MTNGQEPPDVYKASREVVAQANVRSFDELARAAQEDLAGFWAEQAEQFASFDLQVHVRKCGQFFPDFLFFFVAAYFVDPPQVLNFNSEW